MISRPVVSVKNAWLARCTEVAKKLSKGANVSLPICCFICITDQIEGLCVRGV